MAWSGSGLGKGIPKADAGLVSWTVCGVEGCHEKLLPFIDRLEHTSSCARLLHSARGFLPPCLGFLPKRAWSLPQLLQAGVAAGMLHSGGTRIPFLCVLPSCLWGAQSAFETWGSKWEEEEEEHHPQILPPPKLLGMHFSGGITLVSPGILAVA